MTGVHVAIDQAGAGTTVLIAAQPGKRIRVINYTIILDAVGTVAFSDGTDWLSGDMPFGQYGGAAPDAGSPRDMGPHPSPLMVTGVGRPLQITTVGAAAFGHLTAEIG